MQLMPAASWMALPILGSETPMIALLLLSFFELEEGRAAVKKAFKSALAMPSDTSLALDKAFSAEVNGWKDFSFTILEKRAKSVTAACTSVLREEISSASTTSKSA